MRGEALVDVGQDLHRLLLRGGVRRRHLLHHAGGQNVQHALELSIVRESKRGERLVQRGELLSLRRRRHRGPGEFRLPALAFQIRRHGAYVWILR